MRTLLRWLAPAALFAAVAAPAPGAPGVLAVEAGRVITLAGEDLTPGLVLVRGGTIEAVGRPDEVKVPPKAERLSFPDGVLVPAFVEAHTQRGMRTANENLPNAAFVTAADQLDPVHATLEGALRSGIATLLVVPGNATVFGGRGLVVKPVGIAVEEMSRIGERGLKISLAPRPGRTRMEQMSRLRSGLEEARRALEEEAEEEKKQGKKSRERRRPRDPAALPWEGSSGEAPEPGTDPRKRGLADLLEGRLFALAWCETAGDVAAAYRLADEFGFDLVPVLGPGTWRAAPLLAERGATAILGPELVSWEKTPEGREEAHALPLEMYLEGVPFALTTAPEDFAAQYITHQAAVSVRHGVPREVALAAITKVPAGIVGLGDRLGTLEPGKEATMVLMTGDPISSHAWVEKVWIAGEQVYDRSSDVLLKRLLGEEKNEEAPPGEGEKEEEAR